MPAAPTYFATPARFRAWLTRHAATSKELIVGFHKTGTATPCMTWPEAVDEALCRGWIDGVRRRIDDERYQIRFTPRKAGATWSAVNISRVAVLTEQGRMRHNGLAAFAARTEARSRTYSYEQEEPATLESADEKLFRKNEAAWSFFDAQAPSYKKKAIWWVVSAMQDATRQTRLRRLIETSARNERI